MAYSTKAVEFGGSNEYVTMGDVLGFEYTSTRSFSLWFSTVSQGYGWLLSKHGDTPAYQGFGIYQLNTGELLVVLRSDYATSNFLQVTTTAKFNDGKRHHLLVAWDGNATPGAGGVSIWVDAVPQAVTVNQDTLTATILNSHPFNLGARTNISGFWVGMMDEVAVYSTELGSADATWLFNGGEPRALTDAGAPSGLAAWWRMGEGDTHPTLEDQLPLGYSPLTTCCNIGQDGGSSVTNEYVGFPSPATLGDTQPCSMGLWINKNAQGDFDKTLMCKHRVGTEHALLFIARDDRLTAGRVDTGGTYSYVTKASLSIASAWHFLVMTYDGSNSGSTGVRMYLDGVELTSLGSGSGTKTTLTDIGDLYIGNRRTLGTDPLRGRLLHSFVYNKELSAVEVAELYGGGVPQDLSVVGPTANLIHWCALGDGDNYGAGNMVDLSGGGNHGTLFDTSSDDLQSATMPSGGYPGTMTNMESTDVRELSIPQVTATPDVYFLGKDDHEQWVVTGGGGGPITTIYYKMRAQDGGAVAPGYVTWIAQNAPDFAGTGYSGGTPTPIGAMVAGSAVVADRWEETV